MEKPWKNRDLVDNHGEFCHVEKWIKNPQPYRTSGVDKVVDNVDNYAPKRASPTETISPAPIVINKSPLTRFCSR